MSLLGTVIVLLSFLAGFIWARVTGPAGSNPNSAKLAYNTARRAAAKLGADEVEALGTVARYPALWPGILAIRREWRGDESDFGHVIHRNVAGELEIDP